MTWSLANVLEDIDNPERYSGADRVASEGVGSLAVALGREPPRAHDRDDQQDVKAWTVR